MTAIRWIPLVVGAWFLGSAAPAAEAKGALKITFTTSPVPAPNNVYAPNNAVAVWVQAPGGTFVRTIGQWVQLRQSSLVAWQAAAGQGDSDAVSGASRLNHAAPLIATWNLRDRAGAELPDGTYTIRLEVAESNSLTAGQNNQGTFTFVKSAAPQTQTGLANGGFTNVTIEFDPLAVSCSDGVVDAPEVCDPGVKAGQPGACPASCATADACMPATLQGDAATCSATCIPAAAVTSCIDGDGCCAAGCSEADDSDCGAGGPGDPTGGSPAVTGGCATGGSSGGALVFAGLGLALLLNRNTRRRGA